MKIAYLAPRTDLRALSAEAVHVAEVVRAWRLLGHSVELFTSRPGAGDEPIRDALKDLRIRESHNPLSLPLADLAEGSYIGDFFRWSRKTRPHIVYLRHFAATLPALFAARMSGSRFFIEVNGIHEVEELQLTRRYSLLKGLDRIDKIGFRAANGIVAVTEQIAAFLTERHGISRTRVSVVHNGANTTLFRPLPRGYCRERLGINPALPVVVYVGDFARWQGVDILLRSAPLILKEFPKTLFLVVGGGAADRDLRELSCELGVDANVRFAGPVAYEDVPYYVGAGDLAVTPKKRLVASGVGDRPYEYSPLKLYEYMACGRPVVASRLPGFGILEEHSAGILVDPENPGGLAQGIKALLRNERLMREMGQMGRSIAEREYSWNAVAARIAALFTAT